MLEKVKLGAGSNLLRWGGTTSSEDDDSEEEKSSEEESEGVTSVVVQPELHSVEGSCEEPGVAHEPLTGSLSGKLLGELEELRSRGRLGPAGWGPAGTGGLIGRRTTFALRKGPGISEASIRMPAAVVKYFKGDTSGSSTGAGLATTSGAGVSGPLASEQTLLRGVVELAIGSGRGSVAVVKGRRARGSEKGAGEI